VHNESTIDVNRLCSPSSVDIDGQLDRGTDSTKLLVLTPWSGSAYIRYRRHCEWRDGSVVSD